MIATAESIDPNAGLVVISLIAVIVAAVVMVVLWLRTKPPRPPVGPHAMQGGGQTPALVDLLTGGFRVEDDAVPATVIDLAARGWLDVEEVAGGNVIVRLRTGSDELTTYEKRVRRHIERHSVDGVAPAAALTIGPEGTSQRWWKGFVREVNRHGRDEGLCLRRWDFSHLALLWLPIGVAWAVVVLTAGVADRVETTGSWGEPGPLLVALCFISLTGLSIMARRISASDAQAPTDAGMAAASQWLGVRQFLSDSGSFDRAPAASVAIWERQLAYATAMGLAPVVQRELPFEVEKDRHAWSQATGHWRRVRIRYLALRPGWGQSPWSAALSGAVQSLVLGVLVWLGFQLANEEFDLSSLSDGAQDWLPVVGLVGAALALAAWLWTATKFVFGVLDIIPRRTVEGELVRRREFKTGHQLPKVVQWAMWSGRNEHGQSRDMQRRTRYHVAIDDGSQDRIVAHAVRAELFRNVRQGATVRARFTPLLGYVTELTETAPPPATEGAVVHELVENVSGQATSAAASMIGQLGERMALLEQQVDTGGTPLLDQKGEDGTTARDALGIAQRELQRISEQSGSGPRSSDGSSLMAGLSDTLGAVLGRLAPPAAGDDGGDDSPS